MNARLRTVAALALSSLLLAACEGPVGPAGPAGDPGPGVTATFITLDADDFSDGSVEVATYELHAITQEVHDRGLVMAYINVSSTTDAWWALPLILTTTSTTVGVSYLSEVSEITFQLSSTSTDSLASLFDGDPIKVITVPPGTAREALDGVDLQNYRAVMASLDRAGA